MFLLQSAPIDVATCRQQLLRNDAGACAIFEGWVRDHHRGRAVARLEFEAFDAMARDEGSRMVAEIEGRFPGVRVLCVHRTGVLDVGSMAVWIGATSAHRAAAFAACRETIEELKRRLPMWKKEHFTSGAAEWVDCTREQNPAARRGEHFARVEKLREVGATGLARLAAARVLVIGTGGLGCAAMEGLSGSGVGAITVVDHGLIERSNLPRQTLYTEGELGLPKASVAAARLHQRNPHVQVVAHCAAFGPGNAAALIASQDVVLDCSDNAATRACVTAACRAARVPLVQAAVFGFEGTVETILPETPHSADHWGAAAAKAETAELPAFTPAVAVLGHLQAAEAVKVLLGQPVPTAETTLLVDLLRLQFTSIARRTS